MKIKALFAGLLGCINVLFPLASQAADEAVSDKADWLKKSLASVGETQEKPVTLSIADLPAPSKRKSQLRAFKANRHLPRKSDLSTMARLDGAEEDSLATKMIVVEDKSPLAGQVSLNRSEDFSLKAVVAHAKAIKKHTGFVIPEPPKTAVNRNVNPLITSLPNNVLNDVDITGKAETAKTDSMMPSVKERELMAKLSEQMTSGDADVSDDNVETFSADSLSELKAQDETAQSSAGPAPFPLNLLPQQALKSLITGGKRTPIATNPARFGSWRNAIQGQGVVASAARAALPPAGFVSHIRRTAISRAASYAPRYAHAAIAQPSARSLAGTVKQIAVRQVDNLARYAPYTPARVYLF